MILKYLSAITFSIVSLSLAMSNVAPYESTYSLGSGVNIRLDGFQTYQAPYPGPYIKPIRPIEITTNDYTKFINELNTHIGNIESLEEMHAHKLYKGSLNREHWSYHSFPMHTGGFSNRYNDLDFIKNEFWNQKYEYFKENSAQKYIKSSKVDILSPLEKYEYLIGLESFSLSTAEWEYAEKVFNKNGHIPKWYGACHGTAPASAKHVRPTSSIRVKSFNNKQFITFYPSDIKALLSMAWARNSGEAQTVGSRCHVDNDSQENSSCYDVNPAALHLSLTNLIGLQNYPIFMDSDGGFQVWNRPIVSYEYEYFHPRTKRNSKNLQINLVPISEFTNDPYKAYRSSEAQYIIGIWLKLKVVADTPASNAIEDSNKEDVFQELDYLYDLELNKDGRIIGGAWYRKSHPDFLWIVSPNQYPLSPEDRLYEGGEYYDGSSPLPARLRDLALMSSSRGTISYRVIEKLLQLSSKTRTQ